MSVREAALRVAVLRLGSVLGAIVGYGYLMACLALRVSGLPLVRERRVDARRRERRHARSACALRGRRRVDGLARGALARWLDAPVTWLGLHPVLEVLPASLALFAISILGNSLFVYTTDRLREQRAARR